MKKIVFIFSLLALCQNAGADVIWTDGFESGDFSAWTSTSGNWQVKSANSAYVHSGSCRVQGFGESGSTGDILLLACQTVDFDNLSLNYWYKPTSDALESSDHIFVEWSPDGGTNWRQLADYTNTSTGIWQEASFILPFEANDNALFQLRLRAVLSNSADAMWFDDFAFAGELIPEPASSSILLLMVASATLYQFRKRS